MSQKINNTARFVFFGTSAFSVEVLDNLLEKGVAPILIVTTPDTPKDRGLKFQPPPVKVWAEAQAIPFIQPPSLKTEEIKTSLEGVNADFFLVASYGKIIPASIFNIPPKQTLNIHPSLLPKLRGATPIQSALLEEVKTGVSIMLIDDKVDHGNVIVQEETHFEHWPIPYPEAEKVLARAGAMLLAKILPDWLSGKITSDVQKHNEATFTKKIEKKDGEISLTDSSERNYRKFCAYTPWPGIFYFKEKDGKKMRVIVKDAILKDGAFTILKVVPEGKKEMDYETFLRNH